MKKTGEIRVKYIRNPSGIIEQVYILMEKQKYFEKKFVYNVNKTTKV